MVELGSEPTGPTADSWLSFPDGSQRSSRPAALRRLAVVTLVLTLMAATLVGIAPAQAVTASTFTAKATPSVTVLQFSAPRIQGRLTPGSGRPYKFQEFVMGAWQTTYTGRTNSSGYVKLIPSTKTTGVAKYRFYGPATSRYRADYSNTVTVTVKPRLAARLSSASVFRGQAASMTGEDFPVLSGRAIYLQRYYSRAWHTVKRTKTNRYGKYKFALPTTTVGVFNYRVHMPKVSASRPASTTGTRKLTVSRTMIGPFLYTLDARGAVTKREAVGGLATVVLRHPDLYLVDVTTTGKIVSVEPTSTTSRIYVGGGGVTRSVAATAPAGRCYGDVSWASDNRHVIVYEGGAQGGDATSCGVDDTVRYLDTVTKQMVTLARGLADLDPREYTGGLDGTVLEFNSYTKAAALINQTTLARTMVDLRGLTGVVNVEFAPLGDILVTALRGRNPYQDVDYYRLAKADPTAAPRKIASTTLSASSPSVSNNGIRFSPDGKKLTWVDCSPCGNPFFNPMATFVSNADGTGVTRVATFPFEYSDWHQYLGAEWIGNGHLLNSKSGSWAHVVRTTGGSPTWTGSPNFVGWTP